MDETSSTATQQKNNLPLIGAIVVILLLVVGGIAYAMSRNSASAPALQESAQETSGESMEALEQNQGGSPEGAADDTNSMMAEEGSTVTVNVTGSGFRFTPEEIRVKQGQTVKVIFSNEEGEHDFVLDEFNVKTPTIEAGETAEVEFVADKKGTFEYYCSVGQHRQMGMVGNLIVE